MVPGSWLADFSGSVLSLFFWPRTAFYAVEICGKYAFWTPAPVPLLEKWLLSHLLFVCCVSDVFPWPGASLKGMSCRGGVITQRAQAHTGNPFKATPSPIQFSQWSNPLQQHSSRECFFFTALDSMLAYPSSASRGWAFTASLQWIDGWMDRVSVLVLQKT